MRKSFAGGAASTTLDSGISPTDLSITLADDTGWDDLGDFPFVVVFDRDEDTEEKVLIASISGTTLTVDSTDDRGYDGTSAQSHDAGAPIEHCLDADTVSEANDHVNTTTRDDHTQYHNTTRHAAVSHTAAMLASDSVTTVKIVDAAVTNAKIANTAVDTAQLADSAVSTAKIADLAVGTAQLADDAVTIDKIEDDSVDTAQIVDDAVTVAKLDSSSDWADYTPTVSQGTSTNISKTIAHARWCRIFNTVHVSVFLTVSAAGENGQNIHVTLPTNANYDGGNSIGSGQVTDLTGASYAADVVLDGANVVAFIDSTGPVIVGSGFALASGDYINFHATYEVA